MTIIGRYLSTLLADIITLLYLPIMQVFKDGTFYPVEILKRAGRTLYGLGSLLTGAKVFKLHVVSRLVRVPSTNTRVEGSIGYANHTMLYFF